MKGMCINKTTQSDKMCGILICLCVYLFIFLIAKTLTDLNKTMHKEFVFKVKHFI